MKIDVSIITVGYKSEDTIVPFLNSIQKNKDSLKKEIIVVDNYPSDKGADKAEKHPLKPLVIRNLENVGFSKAINAGIAKSKGEYVLIINPDTRIVKDALVKLVNFAKSKNKVGAVAPRLLNNDGKIQASCFMFPNISNAIKYYFFGNKQSFNKYIPSEKTSIVDVAVMAAFLVPRTTLNAVGLLDERFFLYYEDVEFCYRLQKNGYPVYYYADALVKHAHGASGNFRSHLSSPLAKAAQVYHGRVGSLLLNTVLYLGQKWQKLVRTKK